MIRKSFTSLSTGIIVVTLISISLIYVNHLPKLGTNSECQSIEEPFNHYDEWFKLYLTPEVIQERPSTKVLLNETIVVVLYDHDNRENRRDICHFIEIWSKICKSLYVVTKSKFTCHHEFIIISQLELGVRVKNNNPLSIEWFLSNLNVTENFLYICDDYFPRRETFFVYTDFLYERGRAMIHNAGDWSQIRTVKKMFSYGGNFMKIPKYTPMHGPQYISSFDIIRAMEVLKIKHEDLKDVRGESDWSMMAAVGYLKTIRGESSFNPPGYFEYHQARRHYSPVKSMFFSMNDGDESLNSLEYDHIVNQLMG